MREEDHRLVTTDERKRVWGCQEMLMCVLVVTNSGMYIAEVVMVVMVSTRVNSSVRNVSSTGIRRK